MSRIKILAGALIGVLLGGGCAAAATAPVQASLSLKCQEQKRNGNRGWERSRDVELRDGIAHFSRSGTNSQGRQFTEKWTVNAHDRTNVRVSAIGTFKGRGVAYTLEFNGALTDGATAALSGHQRSGTQITRNCSGELAMQDAPKPGRQNSEIGEVKGDVTRLDGKLAKTDEKLTDTRTILGNILLPTTENHADWMLRISAIPVQQQQFCRVIDRFHDDLANVASSRNEIRKNALYRDRQLDLAALLPDGSVNNWVVKVVEVTQAADGSAAVLLQPPCRVMLGSDVCGRGDGRIRATIATNSSMYRELARVSAGDYVTVSGKILYAQEKQEGQPLPQYAQYEPTTYCSQAIGAKDQDVFVTQVTNLFQLR